MPADKAVEYSQWTVNQVELRLPNNEKLRTECQNRLTEHERDLAKERQDDYVAVPFSEAPTAVENGESATLAIRSVVPPKKSSKTEKVPTWERESADPAVSPRLRKRDTVLNFLRRRAGLR
jgi:hypothetical protein